MDSIYCHDNWACSLGGVSFPLLADFHPKGAVARSYGLYLEEKGITDRATVIVDAAGKVRYAHSVTPAGARDMAELAAICEAVDAEYDGEREALAAPPGVGEGALLYVRPNCGFSRAVLRARENLHLAERLPVRDLIEDPEAAAALREIAGQEQVPCLVVEGKPMLESKDIIQYLLQRTAAL